MKTMFPSKFRKFLEYLLLTECVVTTDLDEVTEHIADHYSQFFGEPTLLDSKKMESVDYFVKVFQGCAEKYDSLRDPKAAQEVTVLTRQREVFVAMKSRIGEEGVSFGTYESLTDAQSAVMRSPVMSSMRAVKVRTVTFDGKEYVLNEELQLNDPAVKREELRKQTMAKLTDAELESIGVIRL